MDRPSDHEFSGNPFNSCLFIADQVKVYDKPNLNCRGHTTQLRGMASTYACAEPYHPSSEYIHSRLSRIVCSVLCVYILGMHFSRIMESS